MGWSQNAPSSPAAEPCRPTEEYPTTTEAEWEDFLAHFERHNLSVGTRARAYGTACIHEHVSPIGDDLLHQLLQVKAAGGIDAGAGTGAYGSGELVSEDRPAFLVVDVCRVVDEFIGRTEELDTRSGTGQVDAP